MPRIPFKNPEDEAFQTQLDSQGSAAEMRGRTGPKGDKQEKDSSRYGGGDLPTGKPGSNENEYNRTRKDPEEYKTHNGRLRRYGE